MPRTDDRILTIIIYSCLFGQARGGDRIDRRRQAAGDRL
jgi:hypothetical protein